MVSSVYKSYANLLNKYKKNNYPSDIQRSTDDSEEEIVLNIVLGSLLEEPESVGISSIPWQETLGEGINKS